MEQLALLKELFEPILTANQVKLYDLKFVQEGKMKILQVSIMKEDLTMDIDTCAVVSEQLSALLDEKDLISFEYYLEVCSPGAEREIKDLDELPRLIGSHIFVRLQHPANKMLEITGDLVNVEDGIVTLSYRDKALTKKVSFEQSNIDFARMAVRI
ncbi:MAG: ribosome maturation factor RimP [Erysipelotrichaceae bacterium]|nr:ribosome maturation factor RimP [Erysipelotrichaceae bacterium]